MKAVEFDSTITAAGQIAVPPEFAGEIPAGEHLRVVVTVAAVRRGLGLAISGASEV